MPLFNFKVQLMRENQNSIVRHLEAVHEHSYRNTKRPVEQLSLEGKQKIKHLADKWCQMRKADDQAMF